MPQPSEFGSVIIVIDHTSTIPGPHTVQKMVFSTETLEEAALALLKYYDEEKLLASASTIAQFQEISKTDLPALIYRTPENVSIVMALDTFNALVARSESLLDATSFILDTAGQLIVATEEQAGAPVPLLVLSWGEADPVAEEAPAKPARRSRTK